MLLVPERTGAGDDPVATLRVQRERGGIHGSVVPPGLHGRGIGRWTLAHVCSDLLAEKVAHAHLEVEVAEEEALGLCTSLGLRAARHGRLLPPDDTLSEGQSGGRAAPAGVRAARCTRSPAHRRLALSRPDRRPWRRDPL